MNLISGRQDAEHPPDRSVAGSSTGDRGASLRLPVAICLLVGCMLLQVPVHLALKPIVGKNLAVAAAMLAGMLLPAVTAVLWLSSRPRETFRWRGITVNGMLSVTGVSLSFAFLAGGLFEWLLRSDRIPPVLVELLEREEMIFREIFRLRSGLDVFIVGVLLIVIAPLAEELLFRGLFQASLEKAVGRWPGVLIAALSFGLLHGRVRFIPVTLLGLLMGYMVMRTDSLPVGILAHSLNNLTVLFLSQLFVWLSASPDFPLFAALGGGIGLIISVHHFRSLTGDHHQIRRRGSGSGTLPSAPE